MIGFPPDAQVIPPLVKEFFGVHFAETNFITTSGSLFDLPRSDWGTAVWGTGTSVVGAFPEHDSPTTVTLTGPAPAYPRRSIAPTTDYPLLDLDMQQLETAAQLGNEQAFVAVYQRMDWQQRSPDDFLRGVQLALTAGAHLAARNLSARGSARFPDHAELQKYARILAPPKVVTRNISPRSDWTADRAWLMKHGDDYRGRWVALHDGELMSVANTLRSLTEQVGDTQGLLLTKVY